MQTRRQLRAGVTHPGVFGNRRLPRTQKEQAGDGPAAIVSQQRLKVGRVTWWQQQGREATVPAGGQGTVREARSGGGLQQSRSCARKGKLQQAHCVWVQREWTHSDAVCTVYANLMQSWPPRKLCEERCAIPKHPTRFACGKMGKTGMHRQYVTNGRDVAREMLRLRVTQALGAATRCEHRHAVYTDFPAFVRAVGWRKRPRCGRRLHYKSCGRPQGLCIPPAQP